MIRLVLTEEDFAKLVSGRVAKQEDLDTGETIEIILEDIGFDEMAKIVRKAHIRASSKRASF